MEDYSGAILAIEANDYVVRAVMISDEEEMLDSFETRPYQSTDLLRWARSRVPVNANLQIVGSPLDKWPRDLHDALVDGNSKLYWLPSDLLRKVYGHLAPWHQRRRLHRTRLLAYVGHRYIYHPYLLSFPPELAFRWEYIAAREVMKEAGRAAEQFGISLDNEEEDM